MNIRTLFLILISTMSTLAAAAQHSVTLQGCSSTTPGVLFNFYRGTAKGGESATPLNPAPTVLCFYNDPTVTGLTTYYYIAKAYCATCVNGGAGLSAPSNEVTAVIPTDPQPNAPTGLVTGTIAQNSVPLQWTAPAAQSGYEVIGYYVMRGGTVQLPNPSRIAIVPSWQPAYTDTTCKGPCFYQVKAYDIGPTQNAFVISPASNIVRGQ